MTKKQYGEVAERLAPSLRRIAYSIVHNEQDAQDAVQQALLSVWAHRESVEFARLKPYLTRTVINACRDIQRMRQKMIPMEEMPEASDRQPDSVLRDAIECLPEEVEIYPREGTETSGIYNALKRIC